jgi:hypothetical protein
MAFLTPAFRVYSVLGDNTITNYQSRFVNTEELDIVDDLLKKRDNWNSASGGEMKSGEHEIGRYLGFSESAP